MRAMKDSGVEWIGEIPESWDLKRLKAILVERKEKNDPVKTDFILSLGANYGVVPYSEKEGGGNKSKEDLTAYNLAYTNDIVMNSMNIISGSVGISRYYGCVSPVYFVLYPRNNHVSVNFYAHMFQSKAFQRSLLGLGNGILIKESSNGNFNTVRMRIPIGKLNNLYLPCPSIIEQQRIADYLDAKCSKIDAIISKQEAVIEKLKAYKQSIITEAVTKGLNPDVEMKDSGIDWIGEIPKEWDTIRIKHIFALRDERNYLPLSEVRLLSLYTDIGVFPHGEQEERGNKAVTADGYKVVYKNDLVVNIILAWMGAMGISDYDGVTSPAYDVYKAIANINVRFYHYLFRTSLFAGECYKYGRGIMAMRWRTYSTEFKSITVPFPDKVEQDAIVEYIDSKCNQIDTIISRKQSVIDKLTEYKKSLIYEVVTGKKEV